MLASRTKATLAIAAMLAATTTVTALSERQIPAHLAQSLDSLPQTIQGWQSIGDEVIAADALAMLKPTAYLSRTYDKSGVHLGLFIAYYAAQRAGETMHSPLHCLPGNGWEIAKRSKIPLSVDGRQIVINDDLIRKFDHQELMLYWYQSRRRIFASEFLGKFLLLKDAIWEGHTEGSLVRIVLPDAPGMKEEAVSFAQQLIPRVQDCLGK